MKKILVLLSLSALLGVAFVTPSCSTSQTTTVTKAEGVVVNTVDVGMKTWHDYVVLHLTDGKVTQKEIDNVSTGYTAYYNAQLVVKAMLEKLVTTGSTNTVDLATSNTAVTSAETSLLALINQYLNQ